LRIRGLNPDDAIRELNQSVPIGHIAEPEEIADVVSFLSSDEARYICGSLSGDQWWKSGLLIKVVVVTGATKGHWSCLRRATQNEEVQSFAPIQRGQSSLFDFF
jgi:hypothetical protein